MTDRDNTPPKGDDGRPRPRKLRIERGPYAPPAQTGAEAPHAPATPSPGTSKAQVPPLPADAQAAAPASRQTPPPAQPSGQPPVQPPVQSQHPAQAESRAQSRAQQPPQPGPADRAAGQAGSQQAKAPRKARGKPMPGQSRDWAMAGAIDNTPPSEPIAPPPDPNDPANRPPSAWAQIGAVAGLFARFVSRIVGWLLWIVWSLFWRGAVVVTGIVALVALYNMSMLPPAAELADGRVRGSVTMTDRNGAPFAWRGDQFGGVMTVDQVSPHLRNAVVATEDKRFYGHFGVDPRGVASAIRINLREGRGPLSGNGGSTITQQVSKLLCLGTAFDPKSGMTEAEYEADCRRGTVWRKIQEVPYALALEWRYTKDEILMIYLNRAYLGAGARGFAAASQRYFSKPVSEVTPSEAAMLAGLLVAPTRFAPTNDLGRAQRRAATIVRLMEEQGYLSAAEAAHAQANPAELSEAAEARAGGYFADWVMDTGPSYLTRDTTEDVIIKTTLDQRVQTAAEQALEEVFATKVREGSKAQAAIVVMGSDGAVRAMVGGRNLRASGQFNRATQALRQTGSAFKPFVYAAALDLGWRYDDVVQDTPLTIDVPGSGPWSPRNYTKDFAGPVTLTQALARSLNIPAVRVSEDVGRENVRTVASGFGLGRDLALGPALALGASEATLLEMTAAYAGILNGGSSVTPYGLTELRLQGDAAPLMDQSGGIGERIISNEAAQQLTYMMYQVVETGTGRRAQLPGHQIAGKSGTTQAARDAWFVGFSADYVAGVWMGYDDNTPLTGVTGGGLPAEIWHEAMQRILQDLQPLPLPMALPAPRALPAPQPQAQQPRRQQPRPQPQNSAERVLLEVLGALLGGN